MYGVHIVPTVSTVGLAHLELLKSKGLFISIIFFWPNILANCNLGVLSRIDVFSPKLINSACIWFFCLLIHFWLKWLHHANGIYGLKTV